MQKKWLLLLAVLFLSAAIALGGCSGEDSPTPEIPAEEPAAGSQVEESADEPTADEPAAEDDEALFDFYSTPADWPRVVPAIMNEYKVTRYERTETTMHASGTGDLGISRTNNYYNNAVSGTSYSWEFDPAKTSVTEGTEQVFYLIDDEGRTLTVTLKEIETNKIEFALDFTE